MGRFSGFLERGSEALGKFFGGSTFKRRAITAGSFAGAGMAGSAYIDHIADVKRNYYGEERYNQYYGSGAETVSAGVSLASLFYTGSALLGRDPVTRIRNSYRYRKAWLGNLGKSTNLSAAAGPLKGNLRAAPTSSQELKKLANTPRFGVVQMLGAASMIGGGSISPTALGVGAGIVGTGLVAGAGLGLGMAWKASKGRGFGAALGAATMYGATSSAVVGGGAAVGYAAAVRDNNPIAEGNITQFDRYNSQGVSRMNFSTAGLVQALHDRNRRY